MYLIAYLRAKILVLEPAVHSSACLKAYLPPFSTEAMKPLSLLRYLCCLLFLNSGFVP